jgi:hypothetical protein
MAIEVRTIMKPVEKLCDVKYYVWAIPIGDLHFAVPPPYILEDKYFETRAGAEELVKEWEKSGAWLEYEIREKITEIPEEYYDKLM